MTASYAAPGTPLSAWILRAASFRISSNGAAAMRMLGKLWRDNKSLIAFIFLMVLFRSAIADWNVVPSGSMLPTIREGDRILVDKMAYDLRVPLTHITIAHLHDPQRGDIVTIDSSAAHELIVKRLIGLPGDSVAMRDNVLYVNGVRA